jgi:hypothetical protein
MDNGVSGVNYYWPTPAQSWFRVPRDSRPYLILSRHWELCFSNSLIKSELWMNVVGAVKPTSTLRESNQIRKVGGSAL